MKSAIHTEYGPAEVVRVGHLPDPIPGPGDVLMRVRFSTVNRTDTGFRSAEYVVSRLFSGLLRPKNPVLGCEYAGDVVHGREGLGVWMSSLRTQDSVRVRRQGHRIIG